MKKTYAFIVMAIVVVVSNCFIIEKQESMALLNMNIEALSQSESGGKKCYNEFWKDPDESDIYCQTCQPLPGRPRKKSNCFSN